MERTNHIGGCCELADLLRTSVPPVRVTTHPRRTAMRPVALAVRPRARTLFVSSVRSANSPLPTRGPPRRWLSRSWVATPHGRLELLSATPPGPSRLSPPTSTTPSPPHPPSPRNDALAPIVCLHGGFHSASCFHRLLPDLAARGIPAYALSFPAHGESHHLPLFKHLTLSKHELAEDAARALAHVRALHPSRPPPVLLGHSAGGGIAQLVLDGQRGRSTDSSVSGLILLAAFPASGGLPVFVNWAKLDPGLGLRTLRLGGHPKAALWTPALARRAFFSRAFPADGPALDEVWSLLEPLESLAWPAGLILRFADEARVRWATRGRVAVIGGAEDALMTPPVVQATARAYGVEAVLVDGCGHDVMLDQNAAAGHAAIAEAVVRFSAARPNKDA